MMSGGRLSFSCRRRGGNGRRTGLSIRRAQSQRQPLERPPGRSCGFKSHRLHAIRLAPWLLLLVALAVPATASATSYGCAAYSETTGESSVLYRSLLISVGANQLRDIRLRIAVGLDSRELAAVERLSTHAYACSVAEAVADAAWNPEHRRPSFHDKLGHYHCRTHLVETIAPEYEEGPERRIEEWSCGVSGEDANRVSFLGESEEGSG
jgi:hypothetical protein